MKSTQRISAFKIKIEYMYSFKLSYYFKFIQGKLFTKFAWICYPVYFTVFQYSTTLGVICYNRGVPSEDHKNYLKAWSFFFPEVAQYIYKSTIWPCMEYCCHVWAGAPSCYLELLDKLQNEFAGLLVLHLLLSWTLGSLSKCSQFKSFL